MLTDQQQKNTFIMSNMAPQYAEHNNGKLKIKWCIITIDYMCNYNT